MTDSLLDRFLEKGLLDLKGNDHWYEHITSTASSLSTFLRDNPEDIVPFTYAALVTEVSDQNPAIEKTLDLLRAEWKTYASISDESPKLMLRVIILDALLQNANSDDGTKSVLALLLSSALPHLSVGREEEVWTNALNQLQREVEDSAEIAWTVPSQINVPTFPNIDVPTIRFSVKAGEINQETLEQGIYAASGPSDEQGESTGGNPHWPNEGHHWSHEFAPRAASAISEAISDAAGAKTGSVKPEALTASLTDAITTYLRSFAQQLVTTTYGIEMRSRLLWWKEALVSSSARISYRDIDPKEAPGLMAFDYQAVLPSIAPASVTLFLAETVRTLQSDEVTLPLVEWLQALTASPHADALRATISETTFAEGYRPLISLVTTDEAGPELITKRTVFAPNLFISAVQFSRLVFLELQAIKAKSALNSTSAEQNDTNVNGNANPELQA